MSQIEDDAQPEDDAEVQPAAPPAAVGSPASTDTILPEHPVEPLTPPDPDSIVPSKTKAVESPSATVPILDSNHTWAKNKPATSDAT